MDGNIVSRGSETYEIGDSYYYDETNGGKIDDVSNVDWMCFMYDINIKNVSNGKKVYYFLVAFGFIFFGVGLAFFVVGFIKDESLDSEVMADRVEVNSRVNSEGSTMYSPIYYFDVNGVGYTCSTGFSSSSYPETEDVIVYYDSRDPSNCLTEYSKSNSVLVLLIFGGIGLLVMVRGFVQVGKVNKRVKAIIQLNSTGKLVKNLPYRMEATNTVVNGVPLQRPVVDYALPSGSVVQLYGDARTDKKLYDADGFVDLVIDEVNIENYYIDFEINRLTGNLDSDYYKPKDGVNPVPYYQNSQNNHLPPQI